MWSVWVVVEVVLKWYELFCNKIQRYSSSSTISTWTRPGRDLCEGVVEASAKNSRVPTGVHLKNRKKKTVPKIYKKQDFSEEN